MVFKKSPWRLNNDEMVQPETQRDGETVMIAGNQLVCPVCGGEHFIHRQTLLNTVGATFFKVDWADKSADNYYCGNCGYIFWFHP